jgi:hypothetical protein
VSLNKRDATKTADGRVLLAKLVGETDEVAEQDREQRTVVRRYLSVLSSLGEGKNGRAINLGYPGRVHHEHVPRSQDSPRGSAAALQIFSSFAPLPNEHEALEGREVLTKDDASERRSIHQGPTSGSEADFLLFGAYLTADSRLARALDISRAGSIPLDSLRRRVTLTLLGAHFSRVYTRISTHPRRADIRKGLQ